MVMWLPICCGAQVTVSYTGNMGVLLKTADQAVLIDGLHEFYKAAYLNPSEEVVDDLLNEGGIYPLPDLSLVTHYHGDHYSAQLHSKLKETIVVGSAQVTDPLTQKGYKYTKTVPYAKDYRKHPYEFNGIKIMAFRMDHGNDYLHKNVQNLGYLVELGGYKILHVGDTDWYEHVFSALNLHELEIDLAILPFWLLLYEEGPQWVKELINPKRVVLTHIDPKIKAAELQEIKEQAPQAEVFTVLGQGIVLTSDEVTSDE